MNSSIGIQTNRRGFLGALVAIMAGARLARAGEISPSLQRRIDSHLEAASLACQKSADRAIAAVNTYFRECNDSVMKFVDDASGWYSYGYAIADLAPFTNRDKLRGYLESRFEHYFFTGDTLSQFLTGLAKTIESDIEEAENILQRDVSVDIENLVTARPGTTCRALLRASFDKVISRAEADVRKEHETSTAIFFASSKLNHVILAVVGRVLFGMIRKLAARAGSKGLVAAGASGGFIGLACTVLIDMILSWVWDWWTDPKGKLAQQLVDQFEEIRSMIVDGVDDQPGLKAELATLLAARVKLRGKAINEAVATMIG